MNLSKHPESDRLTRAIQECLQYVSRLQIAPSRFALTKHANAADLVAGLGSQHGRWNSAGLFAMVYSSIELETCFAEWQAWQQQAPHFWDSPVTFARIDANVEVLDITLPAVQRVLAIRDHDFAIDRVTENQFGREVISQAIGRIAWELEIEALIVPSFARTTGRNLLHYPANSKPGSWFRPRQPNNLPQ